MKLATTFALAALLALGLASCGDSSSSESAEFASTAESSAPAETVAESTSTTESTAPAESVAECEFAHPDTKTEWLADNQVIDWSRAWMDDAVDSWLVPAGCVIPAPNDVISASNDEAWTLFSGLWLLVSAPLLGNDMRAVQACESIAMASPFELGEMFYEALTGTIPEETYLARDQQLVRSFLNRWDRPINRSSLEEAAERLADAHAVHCDFLLE